MHTTHRLEMEEDKVKKLGQVRVVVERESSKQATVELLYPTIYKFNCRFDALYFPFDDQTCNLTIGSWTHDIGSINYHAELDYNPLRSFVKHDIWDVRSMEGDSCYRTTD